MDSRLRYLSCLRSWTLLCICDLFACMNFYFRHKTPFPSFFDFCYMSFDFSICVITRQKKIKILSKDTSMLNLNNFVYENKDEQITSFYSQ
jgi:hypothetical protein